MANVISKTPNEYGIYTYLTSVHTPLYLTGDWIINPNIISLTTASPVVPQIYWKVAGSPLSVVEMSQGEKDAVDAALAAAYEEPANLSPAIQVRRTTTYNNIPTTWTDLEFDTTDVESDTTTIEHNSTNIDDIDIKANGLYWIYYNVVCDDEIQGRIRKNDSMVVPGSEKQSGDPSDVNDIISMNSTGIIASLLQGDKITVQIQSATSAENLQVDATLIVIKLQGLKGDKGDPGSGTTIEVQEDDSSVQIETDTLNFEGSGVSVTDDGGGKVTATISGGVFGSAFQQTSVDGYSSTTSNNYQPKASLTTGSLVSGTYRIGWFIEVTNNSTSGRTEVRVEINNSTTVCESSVESEDSHDWVPFSGFYHTTLSGINTIDLDYRRANFSGTSSIRRARLEIWRVS